jgi:hypothetical protein
MMECLLVIRQNLFDHFQIHKKNDVDYLLKLMGFEVLSKKITLNQLKQIIICL